MVAIISVSVGRRINFGPFAANYKRNQQDKEVKSMTRIDIISGFLGAGKTTLIKKQFGIIDWTKPAKEIECLIRGLNPWPSAYTHLDGKMLKLWDADVKAQEQTPAAKPGQIVEVGKDYFTVQTGRDLLVIRSLQLEGKKRMDTEAFLQGYSLTEESILS